MDLESEIFSGDIGSVRNNLARFVKESVSEVVSVSQSSYSKDMLIIVLIYVQKKENLRPFYEPVQKKKE